MGTTAFGWVKAEWSAFGGGSGFCQATEFVILTGAKPSGLRFRALLGENTREMHFERTPEG